MDFVELLHLSFKSLYVLFVVSDTSRFKIVISVFILYRGGIKVNKAVGLSLNSTHSVALSKTVFLILNSSLKSVILSF